MASTVSGAKTKEMIISIYTDASPGPRLFVKGGTEKYLLANGDALSGNRHADQYSVDDSGATEIVTEDATGLEDKESKSPEDKVETV